MSYWVESCKFWFVWIFMIPGGLLSWSTDILLDHMFFVLIGDGQGVLGWLMVGGANLQSLNPKSSVTVYGPLEGWGGEIVVGGGILVPKMSTPSQLIES